LNPSSKVASADLTLEQALSFAAAHSMPVNRLLDLASLHVARSYQGGALTFEDADGIMNGLWGLIFQQPIESLVIPEITQGIFEASDQGDYHHRDDSSDAYPHGVSSPALCLVERPALTASSIGLMATLSWIATGRTSESSTNGVGCNPQVCVSHTSLGVDLSRTLLSYPVRDTRDEYVGLLVGSATSRFASYSQHEDSTP
jgi:hypothetical protein